jgi:uncharacterized iron-regulated protein
MKSLRTPLTLALSASAALALSGCLFSGGDEAKDPLDFGPVIGTVAESVIYPTYSDLFDKATALEAAVQALDTTADAGKLNTARAAWRAARKPWEQSEGFLFGPVSNKGVDPSIDSWPLDSLGLKSILATNATFNFSYVDVQADEVKGFHAIEYLLFGIDSTKTRLTARELDYVRAAVNHFKARTDTLKSSWSPAGENFIAKFSNAGVGSKEYRSKRAAAQELLDGMVAICDEVASGKITEPFENGPKKEESRFSRNSTTDFANNIRSVRNVYLGTYSSGTAKFAHLGHAPGVAAWVDSLDSELAERVMAEIDTAISKTEQVGDFTTALDSNRDKITAARAAIFTLLNTLDKDVRKVLFP